MATTTKVVFGKTWDGDVSTSAGGLAKKINDITTAATTVHSVAVTKVGRVYMAVIVYT